MSTNLQLAAFVPTPPDQPWPVQFHALHLPGDLMDAITTFYRERPTNLSPEKPATAPVSSLNTLVRATMPDLVTTDRLPSQDDATPWLYAWDTYPLRGVRNALAAWIHSMRPSEEDDHVRAELLARLDNTELAWTPEPVELDFNEFATAPNGTAEPSARSYRLIPEYLAQLVIDSGPYRHFGHEVHFQRVAPAHRSRAAELVSWPPIAEPIRDKNKNISTWYFSGYVKLALRTLPFASVPRIHVEVGIRRWVTSQAVNIPYRQSVSCYLRPAHPIDPQGRTPTSFAVLPFVKGKSEPVWKHRLARMLQRTGAIDHLPAARDIAENPEHWINKTDVPAAVVHHTRMTHNHEVHAGIAVQENARLFTWIADALSPTLAPSTPWERSRLKANPAPWLTRLPSIPKKTEQEAEHAYEERKVIAQHHREQVYDDNAARLRDRLAVACEGRLALGLLYQTTVIKDQLLDTLQKELALGQRREASTGHVRWSTPNLEVTVQLSELGSLGGELVDQKSDNDAKKVADAKDAFNARCIEVDNKAQTLSAALGERPTGLLVELEGLGTFKFRLADPKNAIRLGASGKKILTQFITPHETSEKPDTIRQRAKAAVHDLLRQHGLQWALPHTLTPRLPEQLTQVAIWMVKRNKRSTGNLRDALITPIAIKIDPDNPRVHALTPEIGDWAPYPDVLHMLAGQDPKIQPKKDHEKKNLLAQFVRVVTTLLHGQDAVMFLDAQNLRQSWTWLTNPALQPDMLTTQGHPPKHTARLAPKLRIVRVATAADLETPTAWNPSAKNGQPGVAKGLFLPPSDDQTTDPRVFYSIGEPPPTNKKPKGASKLTPDQPPTKPGEAPKDPRRAVTDHLVIPDLLEITVAAKPPSEDAEAIAMFTHQQRYTDDRPERLRYPLALHLAYKANEYALPALLPDAEPEKGHNDGPPDILEDDQDE